MIEMTCTWVPGTLDRLHLRAGDQQGQLSIREFRHRFGLEAMNAVYLSGRYQTLAESGSLDGLPISGRPSGVGGRRTHQEPDHSQAFVPEWLRALLAERYPRQVCTPATNC